MHLNKGFYAVLPVSVNIFSFFWRYIYTLVVYIEVYNRTHMSI